MTSIFAEAPPIPRRLPWATLASLSLHAALLALATVALLQRDIIIPPEAPPIAVEMVTPGEFSALQPVDAPPPVLATEAPAPDAAASAAPAPPTETSAPPADFTVAADGTLTATRFYSSSLLQQPDMQHIRTGLRGFADSERLIQICNIEALEQIERAVPGTGADTLVPYAMAELSSNGLTLTARGAAYRSRRLWYGMTFHCTAAPGYEGVAAFAFKLGDAIPEDRWEEYFLNAEDSDE